MKKKPWKIALIALITIPIVLGLLWLSPMIFFVAQEKYGEKMVQNTKKIASVELISQKKPLVFFELMEQPTTEGVKVKITYEDGSSEVVDAYKMVSRKIQTSNSYYTHYKGMFFATSILPQFGFRTTEAFLEPGLHSIAMYYLDSNYDLFAEGEWEFAHDPEEVEVGSANLGYCMVEVYAQTAEEYVAEHKPPMATVTESSDGKLLLKKNERGLIQLLVKESGTYLLQIGGEYRPISGYLWLKDWDYIGSGVLFCGEPLPDTNDPYYDYYVQLNANEPMYIGVRALDESSTSLDISLTRVPENEVLAQ